MLRPLNAPRTIPVQQRNITSEAVGTRTQDLRIKSPLLYQLSYGLNWGANLAGWRRRIEAAAGMQRQKQKDSDECL